VTLLKILHRSPADIHYGTTATEQLLLCFHFYAAKTTASRTDFKASSAVQPHSVKC